MKTIRIIGLCLVAAFAFSAIVVGSASANELLFKTIGAQTFPTTAEGTSTTSTLETVNGTFITCTSTSSMAEVGYKKAGDGVTEAGTKFAHLFLWNVIFKGCKFAGGGATQKCWNTAAESEEIIVGQPTLPWTPGKTSKIGHLGLAGVSSAGTVPAVLLLVGTFEFTCKIGGLPAKVTVEGSVIGEITSPAPKGKSTELTLNFAQTAGTQALRFFTFSLGGGSGTFDLLTTNILENKALSGQKTTITLTGTELELELHA